MLGTRVHRPPTMSVFVCVCLCASKSWKKSINDATNDCPRKKFAKTNPPSSPHFHLKLRRKKNRVAAANVALCVFVHVCVCVCGSSKLPCRNIQGQEKDKESKAVRGFGFVAVERRLILFCFLVPGGCVHKQEEVKNYNQPNTRNEP